MSALLAANKTGRVFSILVVDDDAMVREATVWVLTDAGYEVHGAVDGVDALHFLKKRGPVDLVITDINMPRMGGTELVQQTRRQWPSLPILLVSGRTQPAGTQPYMSKPFSFQALMNGIDGVINIIEGPRAR